MKITQKMKTIPKVKTTTKIKTSPKWGWPHKSEWPQKLTCMLQPERETNQRAKIKDDIWNSETTNVKLYIIINAWKGGWWGNFPAKPYSCLHIRVWVNPDQNWLENAAWLWCGINLILLLLWYHCNCYYFVVIVIVCLSGIIANIVQHKYKLREYNTFLLQYYTRKSYNKILLSLLKFSGLGNS